MKNSAYYTDKLYKCKINIVQKFDAQIVNLNPYPIIQSPVIGNKPTLSTVHTS